MKIKIIWVIFITIVNIFAKVEGDSGDEKIRGAINTSVDNRESENVRSEFHKNHQREAGSIDSATKMHLATMLRENEQFSDFETREDDGKRTQESHEKILKFGQRVLESVNRHEILGKDARLLKTGKYRIDWWKEDRRLQRIRKRLSVELARRPELKNHLRTLGWRDIPEKFFNEKKSNNKHTNIEKPAINSRNGLRNTLLYKTMMTGFESLLNFDSTKPDEETTIKEPTIFVYMKISISRPSEFDRNEVTATTEIPDSPMKFSLNTHEQDFGPSDVGVIDVTSQGTSMFNSIDSSTSTINSSGQSIDTDRLLQLIPLVVDELRNDCIDEDERRALSWIFGRRLWQLLEREASKKSDETMDKDLAMFLIKGELVERDPKMARRRRGRPRRSVTAGETRKRKISGGSTLVDRGDLTNKRDIDYDFENLDENYDDVPIPDSSSKNFDRDDDNDDNYNGGGEASFHELLDLAAKYESKKLEERREKEREKKMKNKKKWMDEYEDYSYENSQY